MKKLLALAFILATLTGCAASQSAEPLDPAAEYERGYSAGYQAARADVEAENAINAKFGAAAPAAVYPRAAVVTELDCDSDILTVEDAGGIVWKLSGCEDYDIGDVVAMLMQEDGNPDTIRDDLVVVAHYAGNVLAYAEQLKSRATLDAMTQALNTPAANR